MRSNLESLQLLLKVAAFIAIALGSRGISAVSLETCRIIAVVFRDLRIHRDCSLELADHRDCFSRIAVFITIAFANRGTIAFALQVAASKQSFLQITGHHCDRFLRIAASVRSLSRIVGNHHDSLFVNCGIHRDCIRELRYHCDCSLQIAASVRSLSQIAGSWENFQGQMKT